jgi:DNA-binding NtrC family response regulator
VNERPVICLVEDDPIMGESLSDRLLLEGFAVDWHQRAGDALAALRGNRYALVISDIRLPDMSGEELFYTLKSEQRVLPPLIFITGHGSIDKAVTLLKLGAADYITKPFDLDEMLDKIRALAQQPVATASGDTESLLGISRVMRQVEATLPHIAGESATVLITGESGVGKEHVAQLLHRCGDGARPFVAVNCAALSESLLEAELFGYEKGAFTGAMRTKRGLFEQADGGTLLLDEIGEMPSAMQAKLLRVLQDKRVVRVGGEREIPVDVRVVCATNRDLKEMVEAGDFREDLYYRINVLHLHIPPLRERREDILWFAQRFLDDYNGAHPDNLKTIDHSAEQALAEQVWRGNVRELKHCIERACIMSGQSQLSAASLLLAPEEAVPPPVDAGSPKERSLRDYLSAAERDFIVTSLQQHDWHVVATAESLGISRKNLWEKMKKLEISQPG